MRNKNTPRVQIQTLKFITMNCRSNSSAKSNRSLWLIRLSQAGLILILSTSTLLWRKRRFSIAEEMNQYSAARCSSNCLLLQLTTFLSSSVPRIWVFLRAGRTVDKPEFGPQIRDIFWKVTGFGFEPNTKKASETLQPERVPWAKMATVNISLVRARASLPLKNPTKKISATRQPSLCQKLTVGGSRY